MTYEEALKVATEDSYYNDLDALSKARLTFGGHYAFLSGLIAEVLTKKPAVWHSIRYNGEVKSDTAAERRWEQSDLGVEEMKLRKKMKAIEILMTALNSRIMVLKGESKSEF